MGLVTAKEVAKAINTDKYGVFGTFSGWLLMKILKISTLNKIYDRNKHLSEVEFLNAILDEFQIKFEIYFVTIVFIAIAYGNGNYDKGDTFGCECVGEINDCDHHCCRCLTHSSMKVDDGHCSSLDHVQWWTLLAPRTLHLCLILFLVLAI